MVSFEILVGDSRKVLQSLPEESFDTCVTSPPYWGLRDYGEEAQIGAEKTLEDFVDELVTVFREVRRVIRKDGTLWLNLGDTYSTDTKWGGGGKHGASEAKRMRRWESGCKPKDLVGVPWEVAFALRADGWFLRSDIIWHKPNPMPESVTDRPTKAHEYIFLLSKQSSYYYDADAIRERCVDETTKHRPTGTRGKQGYASASGFRGAAQRDSSGGLGSNPKGKNRRSVWSVAPKPWVGSGHYAAYPPELVEPCVLAGSRAGGAVIDPFCGSGTTGWVANRLGRSFVGVELNPSYAELARVRLRMMMGEDCQK